MLSTFCATLTSAAFHSKPTLSNTFQRTARNAGKKSILNMSEKYSIPDQPKRFANAKVFTVNADHINFMSDFSFPLISLSFCNRKKTTSAF